MKGRLVTDFDDTGEIGGSVERAPRVATGMQAELSLKRAIIAREHAGRNKRLVQSPSGDHFAPAGTASIFCEAISPSAMVTRYHLWDLLSLLWTLVPHALPCFQRKMALAQPWKAAGLLGLRSSSSVFTTCCNGGSKGPRRRST